MKRAKGPGRVRWFLDYETQNWDEPVCAVAMSEHGSAQLILQAGEWVRRKRTRRVIDIPQRY